MCNSASDIFQETPRRRPCAHGLPAAGRLAVAAAAVASSIWCGTATALDNGAAPLPYLGWSSWYAASCSACLSACVLVALVLVCSCFNGGLLLLVHAHALANSVCINLCCHCMSCEPQAAQRRVAPAVPCTPRQQSPLRHAPLQLPRTPRQPLQSAWDGSASPPPAAAACSCMCSAHNLILCATTASAGMRLATCPRTSLR